MEYAIGLKRDHKVDLRHQTASEQVGAYALDLHQNGEKVEWARTVNTGIDDPRYRSSAISRTPASTSSAGVNILSSVLPKASGRPVRRWRRSRSRDRLMAAYGFGDHPQLSAVHKPDGKEVNNSHLHIVSRGSIRRRSKLRIRLFRPASRGDEARNRTRFAAGMQNSAAKQESIINKVGYKIIIIRLNSFYCSVVAPTLTTSEFSHSLLLFRERQEIEVMRGHQPEHEPPTPTPAAPAKRRSPSASSRRKLFGSERLQRDEASPSTTGRISG